jgi:hypothetical protein
VVRCAEQALGGGEAAGEGSVKIPEASILDRC